MCGLCLCFSNSRYESVELNWGEEDSGGIEETWSILIKCVNIIIGKKIWREAGIFFNSFLPLIVPRVSYRLTCVTVNA